MEKQRFAELLVNVMQTQTGREFIYELLDTMEVHVPNYVVGQQSVMGYEIGRRSVGEELLRMLRDDTEEGLQLELLMLLHQVSLTFFLPHLRNFMEYINNIQIQS